MNKTINNPNGVAVEETVILDTNRANRSGNYIHVRPNLKNVKFKLEKGE